MEADVRPWSRCERHVQSRHRDLTRLLSLVAVAVVVTVGSAAGGIAPPAGAAFPGQNGLIVFASNVTAPENHDGDIEIFTINPVGAGLTQLTKNSVVDVDPAWSPDGKRIVFAREFETVNGEQSDIFVMNASGTGQINLTHTPEVESQPAWSPDGKHIAYVSSQDSNKEIYVMAADGTSPTRLTFNAAADWFPAWSPDGRLIAFQTLRDGNDEIYVMRANGAEPTNLTQRRSGEYEPAWSPDGKHLAFESDRDSSATLINYEIYTMNADGTNQKRRTFTATADLLQDSTSAWSPDGTQLVFVRLHNNSEDVYRLDPTSGTVTNLTNTGAVHNSWPDWQPRV